MAIGQYNAHCLSVPPSLCINPVLFLVWPTEDAAVCKGEKWHTAALDGGAEPHQEQFWHHYSPSGKSGSPATTAATSPAADLANGTTSHGPCGNSAPPITPQRIYSHGPALQVSPLLADQNVGMTAGK